MVELLPFLLRFWRPLAALGTGVVLCIAAVAYLHSVDRAGYARGVAETTARYQTAAVEAEQHGRAQQRAYDRVVYDMGIQAVLKQRKIEYRTRYVIKEIETRVTPQADAAAPISLGFVRSYDAAASGNPDAAFAYRGPEPDDSATDVKLSEIARVSAGNYGACYGVAEQLKDLQAEVAEFQRRQLEDLRR